MSGPDADIVIHPRRGRNEGALPERALLVVNPAEMNEALAISRDLAVTRQAIFHANLLVDDQGRFCLAGPALGAPAAGILMEKLIVLGVREFWLVSCCGSIDPALAIGDRLVPAVAVIGEGVSSWYGGKEQTAPDRKTVTAIEKFLQRRGRSWHEGVLWSTDAPFRERRSELLLLRERYGVAGIDMEFSALCSIAAHRKVAIGGIFTISDELWTGRWRPGFASAAFRQSSRSLLAELLHYGFSNDEQRQ